MNQASASWPHLPALAQSKTSPPGLGMIQPRGRRSPAADIIGHVGISQAFGFGYQDIPRSSKSHE